MGSQPSLGRRDTPKRNGGRHCCRPPLSLVPLILPEGETAFPREVPAEASRPRSVPQVPSQGYCYPGSGSCGFQSLPCGRSSDPWRVPSFSALRLRIPVPCRTSRKRSFFDALSRFLPPGGFRFRRTLEGKWVRLWLAPLPRASSFRLPGPHFLRLPSLRTSAAFRGAVPGSFSPFPEGRSLPQEEYWH